MKGSTSKVIRELVKHFKLAKHGYPININVMEPLLKMSDKSDEKVAKMSHHASKERCSQDTKQKKLLRYMKQNGQPPHLCHLYLPGETAGVDV